MIKACQWSIFTYFTGGVGLKNGKTQKKKVKTRKPESKKYKKAESRHKHGNEIKGILLTALGVLMLLSFYIDNSIGFFGRMLRDVLTGLFGLPSYLIPPALMLLGLLIFMKHEDPNINSRIKYTIILFILLSAIFHVGYYRPEDYSNMRLLRSVAEFYNSGSSVPVQGGGVVGGLVSMPFLLVFQVLGTIIILTALSLIDIILLTNISIANFIKNTNLKLSLKRQKKAEARELSRQMLAAEASAETAGTAEKERVSLKSLNTAQPKLYDFKIEKNAAERSNAEKSAAEKSSSGKNIAEKNAKSAPVKQEPEIKSVYEKADESDSFNFDDDIPEPLELVIQDMKKKQPKKPENTSARQNEGTASKLSEDAKTGQAKTGGAAAPMPNIPHAEVTADAVQYKYPSYDLLNEDTDSGNSNNYRNQVIEGAKKLEETLASFGVSAKVINVSRGPSVTRYELQPSAGVKVSRIVNLSDDICLNLAASGVRMEAPIPGKAAIGIEVPNKDVTMVLAREVIESDEFSKHPSKLAFAIGKDISGEIIIGDIGKMPHLLIAGATGSGKSVCINSLIVSLLYKSSPDEVKLLMIDPKVVELAPYNGIPHLLIPVVTEPKKAAGALNWAVQEMVNRYKLFADKSVRDIKGYNEYIRNNGGEGILPQIVIIIDELADLMMVAPNDVEDAICRLAQMARAAGMHLVIATQRPSVDVITGVIKANIPSRISFAVSSQIDSRTILDMGGAEKLLGRGDMLYHPVGKPKPVRIQGAFITDPEVERVIDFTKAQGSAAYDENIIEEINSEELPAEEGPGDCDELLPKAIELVVEAGQASVSLIQRKFKVGYARAARIVDQMEARGIVGGFEGSKPRQILISRQQWLEMQMAEKDKGEQ